jgi:hypothetical protein
MFNNAFLSDVTIHQVSSDKLTEYHAHKAVLCAHSNYFMRMFTSNFKVSLTHDYQCFWLI